MSAQLQIRVDTSDTLRGLNMLEKQQYPFALAKALTQTAKDAQGKVRFRTRGIYKLRNKFTERNIRITPAKKSDVRSNRQAFSEVRTDEKITKYMPGHEVGEMRKSVYGKYVAVPSYDLLKKKFRTGRGVKKMYDPANLMRQSAHARSVQTAGKGLGWKFNKGRAGLRTPFILESKKKQVPMIVRRATKKRLPLQYLWILKEVVKIPGKWGFEKAVKQRAERKFMINFRTAMRQAVSTAR